jgi:hypothetical protein
LASKSIIQSILIRNASIACKDILAGCTIYQEAAACCAIVITGFVVAAYIITGNAGRCHLALAAACYEKGTMIAYGCGGAIGSNIVRITGCACG